MMEDKLLINLKPKLGTTMKTSFNRPMLEQSPEDDKCSCSLPNHNYVLVATAA